MRAPGTVSRFDVRSRPVGDSPKRPNDRHGLKRIAAVVTAAAVLLAGCIAVKVGSADAPTMTYYQLTDARPGPASAPAAASGARLAIQSIGGDPLADSTSFLYSRRPGERSIYQFASWAERPSRRLAQLAQQRLESSGKFAVVTQLGQPIGTDWLLTLALDTLAHDISTTPGHARLALRAELIRRGDRTRVAQRLFVAAPPVAEATAPAAVAAFDLAVADVLDQMAPWVEAAVAANPAR